MIKKLLFISLLLIPFTCEAGPPSRINTYTTGTSINASEVTQNEDALFSYLQGGVDTLKANSVTASEIATSAVTSIKIKDATIVNADINASAAIAVTKIAGTAATTTTAQTISGSKTLSGTSTFSGTANVTGTIQLGGVAITSTAAELNIMDGVTSSATEINVLDGIPATLTATEVGYSDGVTSAIQTQLNAKLGSTETAGGDLTGNYPDPTLLTTIPRNIEGFTSSGTWTRPASIDAVYVKVWGGGGEGEGTLGEYGGGGGAYSEGIIAVTGNVTVTVGAGGTGGTDSGTGGDGGTSSFAGTTTIQATGGIGGGQTSGGTGGTATGGDINLNGQAGNKSGLGGSCPLGGAGGPLGYEGCFPGGGSGSGLGAGDGLANDGKPGLVIVYY